MYNALDIAKYIIRRCHDLGKCMSNLKLQKILYFIQAEFLVSKNRPCFCENIVAWNFGPVVPEVYQEYKVYGGSVIIYFGFSPDSREHIYITAEDKQLINGIVDEIVPYSNTALTRIVRRQTPWKEAYQQGENTVISLESLKQYFSEQ